MKKNLLKEINKLLRDERIKLEQNQGIRKSKTIESKQNKRQERRKIKQKLNSLSDDELKGEL